MRRPAGRGQRRSACAVSASSDGVRTRRMPAARHAASTAASPLASAPVCERAARLPARPEPPASSRTGLPASAAAATKASPFRKSSQYSAISLVGRCAASVPTSSATSTSAWFPSDTKRENPRPESAASRPSSSARFPLCETRPIDPPGSSFETSRSALPASKMPRQFGPTSTAPAARTRSTTARSRSAPSPPSSPRPAVIATRALAPTASEAPTDSSNEAAGTTSATSSGASGSSSSER